MKREIPTFGKMVCEGTIKAILVLIMAIYIGAYQNAMIVGILFAYIRIRDVGCLKSHYTEDGYNKKVLW